MKICSNIKRKITLTYNISTPSEFKFKNDTLCFLTEAELLKPLLQTSHLKYFLSV